MIYFWIWYYTWQIKSSAISLLISLDKVTDALGFACMFAVAIIIGLGMASYRISTIGKGVD